jgi:NADP-dependent 3-hydroxy acid dehydrogenase YdfG
MPSRVLITGAAGGIGRALAASFTDAGYEVIATARQEDALTGVTCHQRVPLDVTDSASVARAMQAVERVDVLVNNAGAGAGGPTEHVPLEAARRVVDVNFFGAARMIQAVLPQMRQRGEGVIVAMSSMCARLPWPFGSYYAASKAAVEALHEAVALELTGSRVRVIIAEPGIVETKFGEKFAAYGADCVDYEPLASAWRQQFDGVHLSPNTVADQVVTCVHTSSESLVRLPIGHDADEMLAMRIRLSTVEFLSWFAARHNFPVNRALPGELSTDMHG